MKKYIFILILILTTSETMNSQIFYNKSKPISFNNKELTNIEDLPSINFSVNKDGNLVKGNLNIDIKEKALIEKYCNKNIARLKISLDVLSFGNITLRFSDIKLSNNAHCYVYTNDYKIVAGPIYQSAINDNLNIVKIPAKEMLVEVVFDNINDFYITLNSVSYQSIKPLENNSIKNISLQGVDDFCPCTNGIVDSYPFDSLDYQNQWLGYTNNNSLFFQNDKYFLLLY